MDDSQAVSAAPSESESGSANGVESEELTLQKAKQPRLSSSDILAEQIQDRLKDSPFGFCRFSTLGFLGEISGRTKCKFCSRSCKYYCAFCLKPTCSLPQIELPIKLDVIHHPSEKRQKSTAMHAAVVSSSTSIYENPDFPDYDPETTVLLYPSKDSKLLEEVDLSKCKTVVFIDSTWQQSGAIFRQEKLSKIPCVKIHTYKTAFWRYQKVGDHCLATIEAIYYFFKEYHERIHGTYSGEYDDLLLLYAVQHEIIQGSYQLNPDISFRHINGYIKYDSTHADKGHTPESQPE